MNKNLHYCTMCKKEEEFFIKEIIEQYEVKGEKIEVEAKIRICKQCGSELFDMELDQETILSAYNAFRKMHGLLFPEQIKKIREKYGLSAASFSKLLGFGEKTITRYENGALQDNAQNNLIALMDDLHSFKKLWERNKEVLSSKENLKINEVFNELNRNRLTCLYPMIDDTALKFVWDSKKASQYVIYDTVVNS